MKKLSLILALVLLLCSCTLPLPGIPGTSALSGEATRVPAPQTTEEPVHVHQFTTVTVVKEPCILAGEQVATCACGETQTSPLPSTGVHRFENGVCKTCGQGEIPLTPVNSIYDADGDGSSDTFYFSPQLADRFANALHIWAGDYDKSLSSSKVNTTTAAGIPHWYVDGVSQYMVFRVTVPEDGLYEMVIHVRMKDAQERGAKYTVNAGTANEQIFETSHAFEDTGFEAVRDAATLSSYMYGITVSLTKGENTIRVEHASASPKCQHYRDLYFAKVGEFHIHSYENETVTLAATCGKDGQSLATCACGRVRTTLLPATEEHTFVNNLCTGCQRPYVEAGILHYDFLHDAPGFAGGTLEFCPEVTDTFSFYWGDDKGALADHTLLYSDLFAANQIAEVTIQSFTAIPKGATRLLAVGSADGRVYSYTIPEERRLTAEALYVFGALSDTHQGTRYGSTSIPYNHFINAAKVLHQKGAIAVGICGDFSYDNIESEYILHANAIKEIFAFAPDMPIFTTSGNHEAKYTGFSKDWYLQYTRNVVSYDSSLKLSLFDGNDLDTVVELPDGSVMIFLHQKYYDYGKATSRLLDDSQLDWLGARLEQYKDRTVFLYFHTFMDEEVGDASSSKSEYSLPLISSTVEYKRFTEYFTKYTNVVYFSGHSHWAFDSQFVEPKPGKTNYDKNIDNKNGSFATMVHIPACSTPRVLTGSGTGRSEGYIVHVYEDYVIFEGYDFVKNQTFAYATYIIEK